MVSLDKTGRERWILDFACYPTLRNRSAEDRLVRRCFLTPERHLEVEATRPRDLEGWDELAFFARWAAYEWPSSLENGPMGEILWDADPTPRVLEEAMASSLETLSRVIRGSPDIRHWGDYYFTVESFENQVEATELPYGRSDLDCVVSSFASVAGDDACYRALGDQGTGFCDPAL